MLKTSKSNATSDEKNVIVGPKMTAMSLDDFTLQVNVVVKTQMIFLPRNYSLATINVRNTSLSCLRTPVSCYRPT